jgi:hypothetical protein
MVPPRNTRGRAFDGRGLFSHVKAASSAFLHALGYCQAHAVMWTAQCGKVMRKTQCTCGRQWDIRLIAAPGYKVGRYYWS